MLISGNTITNTSVSIRGSRWTVKTILIVHHWHHFLFDEVVRSAGIQNSGPTTVRRKKRQ